MSTEEWDIPKTGHSEKGTFGELGIRTGPDLPGYFDALPNATVSIIFFQELNPISGPAG